MERPPLLDREAEGRGILASEHEQHFALRGGFHDLVLDDAGVRHPETTVLPSWLARERHTPYGCITHFALGGRGMRIGTARGCHTLLRRRFVARDGPEAFAEALMQRIAARPEGRRQLARMAEIDERAHARHRCWVSLGASALCVVAFGIQLLFQPQAFFAGEFSAQLLRLGEFWRLVTANLLHGSLLHLLLNLLGLRILGGLVERALGGHATFLILVVSGLSAMGASFVANYSSAVGASGMVFGLAGALLWIEFAHPSELPVYWRLPRRLFLSAVLLETLALAFVPVVATAAHVGGLAAGFLAARGVSRETLRPTSPWLVRINAPLAAAVVVAIGAAVWSEVSQDPHAVVQRAERLLAFEDIEPVFLNNLAWQIATSEQPSEAELSAALRLAERAVADTHRDDPHLLDTLAEVHFVSGHRSEALSVIEEAILLDPDEPYYREQRRRFLGERDPADRPADPGAWPPPSGDRVSLEGPGASPDPAFRARPRPPDGSSG